MPCAPRVEYVGATLDDVVRTVTYVLDIDAYYAVAEERYKYFNNSLPTNTLIAVSRLAHPDMQIEIEAEAIVDRHAQEPHGLISDDCRITTRHPKVMLKSSRPICL